MKSRHGSRLRLLCRTCGRTFCNRRGSAYYRLQTPRRTLDRFAALLAEGLSCASLARILDVCPGTISRWLARASKHARAFADEHDRIRKPVEMQFDEISARPANQPGSPWIFNGIEVSTRYWVAAVVGRRSRRTTRAFVLQARQACGDLSRNFLVTSDPFPYYERELRRGFGPACVYVQVKNYYRQDKIKHATASIVIGSEERLRDHLACSEDSKRPNTAYVERLNLFLRRSCSYLHRRTSGKVRNPERLASAVEILRCAYNFIRPHARLRLGREGRTPAMQAGIFDRVLSWRAVFGWPLRPPRPAVVLAQSLAAGTLPYWDGNPTVWLPSRVAAEAPKRTSVARM
jgi:IS1 family transposase